MTQAASMTACLWRSRSQSIDPYPRWHGHDAPVRVSKGQHINSWEAQVIDTFKHIQSTLQETPHLLRLGRLFSEIVLIEVDGNEYYLTFEKGRIVSVDEGPSRKTPWRFALRTDAEALGEILAGAPRTRLSRRLWPGEDRPWPDRRRHPVARQEPALFQGSSDAGAFKRGVGRMSIEPIIGRYVTVTIRRRAAPHLFRRGRAGTSGHLPAHRRRGHPPMAPSDE